jgi:hypothetical protein
MTKEITVTNTAIRIDDTIVTMVIRGKYRGLDMFSNDVDVPRILT